MVVDIKDKFRDKKVKEAKNIIKNLTDKKLSTAKKIREIAIESDCNYRSSNNINVVFVNALRQIAADTKQSNRLVAVYERYCKIAGIVSYFKRYVMFNDPVEIEKRFNRSQRRQEREAENKVEQKTEAFEIYDYETIAKNLKSLVQYSAKAEVFPQGIKAVFINQNKNVVKTAINKKGISCRCDNKEIDFDEMRKIDINFYNAIMTAVLKRGVDSV